MEDSSNCSETFAQFLYHEIARYQPYGHAFAVLLLEAPDSWDDTDTRAGLERASAEVRDLLRACDLMAVFEGIGVIAALLPETPMAGSRAVLSPDWTNKLTAYPFDAEVLDSLLGCAEALVQDAEAPPEIAQVPHPEPPSPFPLP